MKAIITITLIDILLAIGISLSAQSIRYPVSMSYNGPGAYSGQQSDPFSFTGNQAALANVQQAGFGLFGERRFMLAATGSYSLAAVMPTRLGPIGIQLNYAGYKYFNENKIGIAYARSLGPRLDIGIQFNYYSYRIPGYANAGCPYFEAGAILHFTSRFSGGLQVYNPVGGKLGKGAKEKLAATYKAGLGYDASDHFFVGAEVSKEEDKPVNITAGMQYHFARQFFIRAGISSASSSLFAGAGVSWKNLRLDVAASYHQQLGFSPGILLITHFNRKIK